MKPKTKPSQKSGSIALFAALSLTIVLGFMALVVDIGLAYWIRQQEQTTAEAAALAAAKELDGTPTGLTNARNTAAVLVAANDPNNTYAFNSSTEVLFGVWEGTAFTPETEPLVINAVKINVIRSADKSNAHQTALAGTIFGVDSLNVSNSAIALATFPTITDINCGLASKGALSLLGSVVLTGDGCGGGNVIADGSVGVTGNLACGPNSTISVTGSSTVSGSTNCLAQDIVIPDVTLPNNIGLTNNNSNASCSSGALSGCLNTTTRNVSLNSSKTLTLPAGTYYFNDISITGQGQIIVTGQVTIYVTGSISAAGNSISTSANSNPDDLQILVAGTGDVSFSGTSDFQGHIYAPQSNVNISGTAGYTGSITGNTTTVTGTPDITAGGTIPVTSTTTDQDGVTAALVK